MTNAERQSELITEIDVTYGDDEPWYGFEKLDKPVAPKDDAKSLESVWLTVRKGVKRASLAACIDLLRTDKYAIL